MPASKRLQTAQKFISHFSTIDDNLLESLLAENYHHQFAPASLNPPGPFDKAGYLAHVRSLKYVLKGFPVTAKEYIESESSNTVVVWATAEAQFMEEVKDDGIPAEEWAFQGEYIYAITMDHIGEKIVRSMEFLDSKGTERLLGLAARAGANLEKRAAGGKQ
ncbi:uncharacterized protein BJX67DRAFT_386558 [Aspergillus lucknowensis]|uniref:SnoaL-like domain-containing protein n=1 Tax=Aspergillus lucknowensis TaxID=176173 RepID=A0ABR4L8T4_9EURO